MERNPDKYFVLHGRETPVRDKDNGYLTNSQRTLSTRNLSQTGTYRPTSRNSAYNSSATFRTGDHSYHHSSRQSARDTSPPDNPYSDIHNELRAKSSELSLDLRSLNSSLNKSLNKSVTFSEGLDAHKKPRDENDYGLEDTFEEELERLIANDAHENAHYEENLAGKPQSKSKSQWFTQPIHLHQDTQFPVFDSLGAKEHTVSSVKRTTGMLGTEMAQKKVAASLSLDEDAAAYFPVTFGEVPAIMQTLTPQPPMDSVTQNAMHRTTRSVVSDVGPSRASPSHRQLASAGRKPMSASSRLHHHQDSARYSNGRASMGHSQRNGYPANGLSQRLSQSIASQDPQTKARKDYSYLKASQQFVDQKVVASPFEYELAKLRMERLRLEESRILETKRQEELERIRGPTPKWYELKTPNFTYEHAKNNQLNSSRKNWQSLYDYRTKLLAASQEFAKSAT